jgi:hypothetical protein
MTGPGRALAASKDRADDLEMTRTDVTPEE